MKEPELPYDHDKHGHMWFYFECGPNDPDPIPTGIKHHWHERWCMYPTCGAMQKLNHTCGITHKKIRFANKVKGKDWIKISLKTYSPRWYDKWKDTFDGEDDFKKWEENAKIR